MDDQIITPDDRRRYIPERDYHSNGYKPFGKPFDDLCKNCDKYYAMLHSKGLVRTPKTPKCNRHVLEEFKSLQPNDFSSHEEYLDFLIQVDPVSWAYKHFGWEARHYQSEMLLCSADLKVVRGGRRIGKSSCVCILSLWSAITSHNWNVLVVAPFQAQVQRLFDEMNRLLKSSAELTSSIKRQTNNPCRIEFNNGSILLGFSSGSKSATRSDKVRGQDAHLIVVDEMDFLADEDLEAIMAILASHPHCKLWASSTPTGRHAKFFKFCYPLGTRVFTPDGSQAIETLKVGEKVLGASGYPEYISTVFERPYNGDLIKLKFKKTYRTLTSTSEHPHLVKRNNRAPEFLPAGEIRPGDFVGLTLPKTTFKYLPYPDIPLFRSRRKLLASKGRRYTNNMKALIRDGYLGTIDQRLANSYNNACKLIDTFNSNTDLLKKFYRWMGYYISEGNIVWGHNKIYYNGVQTTHHIDEAASLEVELLSKALFPDSVIRRNPKLKSNSIEIFLYSPPAAILAEFFGKTYAVNKSIHASMYNSSFTDELIQTYLIGDGYIDSRGCQTFSTVSEKLADQVWRYWLSQGKIATLSMNPSRKGHIISYTGRLQKSGTSSMIFIDQMPFVKVLDNSKCHYNDVVYNIETTHTNTYSAEGFATHNCQDKSLGFKEFWSISAESPSWTEEAENFFKNTYDKTRYDREFLAEFGIQEGGVFRNDLLDASIQDYKIPIKRESPQSRVVMGVDWNGPKNGVHIVITEYWNGKFKVLLKEIIRDIEYTQHAAVERIIALDTEYRTDYIYVDSGYGSTQVEMLHKYGKQNPGTLLQKRVVPYSFGKQIEIRDPRNGAFIKKHAKPFLVGVTAVQLEQGRLILPASEDTIIGEETDDDAGGKVVGLVQQMRNFRVLRESILGLPTYSSGDDHTMFAFLLSIVGFVLEFSDMRNIAISSSIYSTSSSVPGKLEANKIESSTPIARQLDAGRGPGESSNLLSVFKTRTNAERARKSLKRGKQADLKRYFDPRSINRSSKYDKPKDRGTF